MILSDLNAVCTRKSYQSLISVFLHGDFGFSDTRDFNKTEKANLAVSG